jgi:hypothetical protein
MPKDKNALSLPSVVGDETIIGLQKAVQDKRPEAGLFTRHEVAKGGLLYAVGSVPDAIYMLRGGTIRLRTVDGRPVKDMPVTTVYHAAPGAGSNRPLLGARYFFNRNVCTLQYVAETACSLYKITSPALRDLHEADRDAVITLMYWLVSASDLSDLFIPIVNKNLGLERIKVDETLGLLRAVEEFRSVRDDPRLPSLLYKLFKKFVSRRIERAEELGIEASIVPLAPTF